VLRQARVRTSLTAGVQAVWLVKDVGARAVDAQDARRDGGETLAGVESDVRAAVRVHRFVRRVGRGLAFESWLLAGETYLHVQSGRCFSHAQAGTKGAVRAGWQGSRPGEVSLQANGRCRRLRHDQPSRSGTWELLVVVRSRAAAGVVVVVEAFTPVRREYEWLPMVLRGNGALVYLHSAAPQWPGARKAESTENRLSQDCAMRT
jgi:hypothetical protein